MQVIIDASDPPAIQVYFGIEEIQDIVELSIGLVVNELPVLKILQITRDPDENVVFQNDEIVLKKTEFAFEKLSFTGDWSRLARALNERALSDV
jgi:hypothetical protein